MEEQPKEEKSKIKGLKQKLYSREFVPEIKEAEAAGNPPTGNRFNVKGDWTPEVAKTKEHHTTSILKKALIGGIVFLVIALIIAAIIVFSGTNIISGENVSIEVTGPVSIAAGEELEIEISVDNRNAVALDRADLIVEFPDGTRATTNISQELTRYTESVGSVGSGELLRRNVQALLFGEQDTEQIIKVFLEYRVEGSNATFSKAGEYKVQISSAPVVTIVEYPAQVSSSQEIEFIVTVRSNSNTLLENVIMEGEYPFGFTFTDATPRASRNDNVWKIGDLDPGNEIEISIRGILEGQDNEERTFFFKVGIADPNTNQIKTAFVNLSRSITIVRPFLGLSVNLNGNTAREHVTNINNDVKAIITWQNNLPSRVIDAKINVEFDGNVFDPLSVKPSGGGFFRSIDNTVIWDRGTTDELSQIDPGGGGSVTVSFKPLSSSSHRINTLRNPAMFLNITISGVSVSPDGGDQNVGTTLSREIKVASNIDLNSRLVHSIGPFANTGSIPPKVNEPTSYTVIWSLTNTFNDVGRTKVVGVLPPYVDWVGQTLAAQGEITYNERTRTITWDASRVPAATGHGTAALDAQFQLSFLPSISQLDTSPIIMRSTNLEAIDLFTNTPRSSSAGNLTTSLPTDPQFDVGDDRVVR